MQWVWKGGCVNFTPKAIIFSSEQQHGFIPLLKQFLFKVGLRETIMAKHASDISRYMFDNFWPIVFIDCTDGLNDGFALFEALYKTSGFQLVPFIFIAPPDKKIYHLLSISAGATGVVKKPLQIMEAEKLLQVIIPPANDPVTGLALQISRIMLKGDFEKAIPALTRLSTIEKFRRGAEISLVRCEIGLGHISKAEDRLRKLLKENPKEVRILCELSDFLKRNSQYQSAQRCYQRIREMHPQMTIKIWDQILMHFELDQLDEAAVLLETLQNDSSFKELSTEGFARIMLFMGLADHIPQLVKQYPNLYRQYSSFSGFTGKASP